MPILWNAAKPFGGVLDASEIILKAIDNVNFELFEVKKKFDTYQSRYTSIRSSGRHPMMEFMDNWQRLQAKLALLRSAKGTLSSAYTYVTRMRG